MPSDLDIILMRTFAEDLQEQENLRPFDVFWGTNEETRRFW